MVRPARARAGLRADWGCPCLPRSRRRPMSMQYEHEYLPAAALPRARLPLLQHLVDTYASETSKTAGVWSELTDPQLEFRPHSRSSSVRQILVHQLLSERRF